MHKASSIVFTAAPERRPVLILIAAGLGLAVTIVLVGVLPYSGPLGWQQ